MHSPLVKVKINVDAIYIKMDQVKGKINADAIYKDGSDSIGNSIEVRAPDICNAYRYMLTLMNFPIFLK